MPWQSVGCSAKFSKNFSSETDTGREIFCNFSCHEHGIYQPWNWWTDREKKIVSSLEHGSLVAWEIWDNFLHVSNTQGLFIRLLWLNIFYHFNCKTYPWSDWKQETKTSCSKIKVQSPFSPSCILFNQWLRMEHWLNVVGTYRRFFLSVMPKEQSVI